MWPSSDSGFEPSTYSPAGQSQQQAQIAQNLRDDPAGVWRALRESWGAKIIIGGIAAIAVIVGLSTLLHL